MIAALALLLVGCDGNGPVCDLQALLDDEAREDARDCGTGPEGDDAQVMACVAAAFRDGVPFRGVVQDRAPDGTLAVRAWAGDEGGVRVLLASFRACGDDGCRGSVYRLPCVDPNVVGPRGAERLDCVEEPGCGELVCGGGFEDCG